MTKTKITFRLILAALVATVALASCTKEPASGKVDTNPKSTATEGSRVIAVSFANATKTAFTNTEEDGMSPYFEEGDEIFLCSDTGNPTEENTQTCTVHIDETTKAATITTKLSGELTAYYPASFVTESKKHGLFIYVPSVQDGTFANANICSANIEENATSANFENMYALFTITPPAGTKKLTIKSLGQIGEDGQRSNLKRNHICDTGDDLYKITVGDGTNVIPSPCYVAMIGGSVKLSDLSFEATSDEEGATGYIKGITTSAIAAKAGTDVAVGSEAYNTCNTVAEGTAYTIDSDNWHEYVKIGDYKWATMNIGADTPEGYGDYFAYGEVVGHKAVTGGGISQTESGLDIIEDAFSADFDSFDFSDATRYTGTCDKTAGFAQCNSPYYDGNDYSTGKYNISTGKQVLDLADDGANANWGGAWRMPTKDEMASLTQVTATESESPKGLLVGTGDDKMFIPYAGVAKGGYELTFLGYFLWSSSLYETGNERAYSLFFGEGSPGKCESSTSNRFFGLPIRAIIDDPDAVTPPTPEEQENLLLPGRFTVGSDKEVNFTKGNLYWDGSKWAIEENQYDFSPHSSGYVSNHVSLLFWTKDANNSYVSTYSETGLTGVDHLFCDGSDADHFLTIGGNTGLYALSFDEWKYLLNTRTDASTLYSSVSITVNDGPISCLAIAPDKCIGEYSFVSSKNSYTLEEYTAATAAGVLFLPTAGYRSNDNYDDSKSNYGFFWTSTPQAQNGKIFDFTDTSFAGSCTMDRSNGCSIRLVKKVPQAQK